MEVKKLDAWRLVILSVLSSGWFLVFVLVSLLLLSWFVSGWIGVGMYLAGLFSTTLLPDIFRKPHERLYFRKGPR